MIDLGEIRKEYTQGHLDESKVADNPFTQFHAWFEQYRETRPEEPTIMTLGSVDAEGMPWQRVLLLKGYDEQGFVFFTNYESNKGCQLDASGKASMHFFWIGMERQVQIQGRVERVARDVSEAYFHSRPHESQLGALASQQSRPLSARAELEGRYMKLLDEYEGKEVPLPDYWGGYRLVPERVEFWQGGEHRLHDRVEYRLQDGSWMIQRLNP